MWIFNTAQQLTVPACNQMRGNNCEADTQHGSLMVAMVVVEVVRDSAGGCDRAILTPGLWFLEKVQILEYCGQWADWSCCSTDAAGRQLINWLTSSGWIQSGTTRHSGAVLVWVVDEVLHLIHCHL